MCVFSHSRHAQFFATIWTVTHQAPLSVGFSRQEYWSGLLCPPPGELPDLGVKPMSPALPEYSLPLSHRGCRTPVSLCFNCSFMISLISDKERLDYDHYCLVFFAKYY